MYKFKLFITETEKLRKGLPQIHDLKAEHFHELTRHGKLQAKVTEKTDGSAFEVGHDEKGFYTRTSHSDKMRKLGDYWAAVKAKHGEDADPSISSRFDTIHGHFQTNKKLTKYLKNHAAESGGSSSLKGEIFHIPSGFESDDKKHVTFVGTKYAKEHMGSEGMFVHHTQLSPEHSPYNTKELGDSKYKFDHDQTDEHLEVPTDDIHSEFIGLDHSVMKSRKHSDRERKAEEQEKFTKVKDKLHKRVSSHLNKLAPKWGPETEGHVLHPSEATAPRVKVLNQEFKDRKKAYLNEGGNIKVNGQGSVAISMEKRGSKAKDFREFFHELNKKSKHKLYGKEGKPIDSGEIFAGSSAHYFNDKIKDADLKKIKPSFGDVDVMVPQDSHEHLDAHLKDNKQIGKFKVLGTKKTKSQYHTIVQHKDGNNHQIDFEFKPFENGKPSEFAKWSQSSHLRDLGYGLKGSVRNLLLSSLTAAKGFGAGFVKKTGSHTYMDNVERHSYSPSHGLRLRHEPTGETYQGLPVYKEAAKTEYVQDIPKILKTLVGKRAAAHDVEDSVHFHGVAAFAAQHLSAEEKRKVAKKFLEGNSKKEYTKDEVENRKLQKLASNHFSTHFRDFMPKVLTEAAHFKIAMAAGRFTGPSKEHEKLIRKVFQQKADKHYVFVMGPESKEKTTAKDPMTVDEKVKIFRKLYPKKSDAFIPAKSDLKTGHAHIKGIRNPLHAMNWISLKHKKDHDNLHLNIVAGDGDEGVEKEKGGSTEKYGQLFHQYNNTTFKSDDEDAPKQKRMEFSSLKITGNKRGKVSGTMVRDFAKAHDHDNPEHLAQFKKLIHSKIDVDTAKQIMKTIKERSTKKKK